MRKIPTVAEVNMTRRGRDYADIPTDDPYYWTMRKAFLEGSETEVPDEFIDTIETFAVEKDEPGDVDELKENEDFAHDNEVERDETDIDKMFE